MLIIRDVARLFEHLLPLIKEQEGNGNKYLRDEDDGITGKIGVNACCCKRIYFDDGKDIITFKDKTKE